MKKLIADDPKYSNKTGIWFFPKFVTLQSQKVSGHPWLYSSSMISLSLWKKLIKDGLKYSDR